MKWKMNFFEQIGGITPQKPTDRNERKIVLISGKAKTCLRLVCEREENVFVERMVSN